MHYKIKIWVEENEVFPIIDTVIVEDLQMDSEEESIFLTKAVMALEYATNQQCYGELEVIK